MYVHINVTSNKVNNMSIQDVANAFVSGQRGASHNSKTDGQSYWLHGNKIAEKGTGGSVIINWCGWYSVTTANHLNHIAVACDAKHRFSRKIAQDNNITTEILHNGLV